jgi:hypothetical protein
LGNMAAASRASPVPQVLFIVGSQSILGCLLASSLLSPHQPSPVHFGLCLAPPSAGSRTLGLSSRPFLATPPRVPLVLTVPATPVSLFSSLHLRSFLSTHMLPS